MGTVFFNAQEYFGRICKENKLAVAEKFHFTTCPGIENLEGVINDLRKVANFFVFDDTTEGQNFRGSGGGYFRKRVFTVSLLRRYRLNDMEDREKQLSVCRELYKQIVSRLIKDKTDCDDLIYLKTDSIFYREFNKYMFSGCTGLCFMLECSEPENLCYNAELWQMK